jgi:hypothetical protein
MTEAEPPTAFVRLFAPVDNNTMIALLSACDQFVVRGVKRVHLLISTTGGSVFHGSLTLSRHQLSCVRL